MTPVCGCRWHELCAVQLVRAGGPLPTPRQASLLYNWPPPQLTGIFNTLNGRHLKMGVFPLLSFLLIVGIWERRKQIFIFLIINLLFLVLLNLYNYILTGTCMKRSLQSEQDIRTKKWNASVVVGCCGGEGWGESLRRFSKLNHYWVEPWLSLAKGTADYKASKKWVPGCLTLIFCTDGAKGLFKVTSRAKSGQRKVWWRVACITPLPWPCLHGTMTGLGNWEVSSAATTVLVIAAVWAAPVEGELVRTVAWELLTCFGFQRFSLCIW